MLDIGCRMGPNISLSLEGMCMDWEHFELKSPLLTKESHMVRCATPRRMKIFYFLGRGLGEVVNSSPHPQNPTIPGLSRAAGHST